MPRDRALGAAIARLPATIRWIVILGERDGLSTREIADLAGVSLDLVKSMQAQGLALIQKDILIGCGAVS
jgi:DNA-directed RNA polymerase specialized sigma24 family protein